MELKSDRELENTRLKLRDLERWYAEANARNEDNERIRVATQSSLKRLINQLKEEITRYESRQVAARDAH